MDISQDALFDKQVETLIDQIRDVNSKVFRPPSKLNILEYAQSNLYLPSEFAAVPGPYSTNRNQWQAEILKTITHKNRTVLMVSSQMGKSICQLAVCHYFVSQKPSPILYVVPNDKMAIDFSIGRFTPSIKASGLAHLFKREEDGSNTTGYKKFAGGQIWFRSAGSSNNLTAITAKVVLLDEIDKYEPLP